MVGVFVIVLVGVTDGVSVAVLVATGVNEGVNVKKTLSLVAVGERVAVGGRVSVGDGVKVQGLYGSSVEVAVAVGPPGPEDPLEPGAMET